MSSEYTRCLPTGVPIGHFPNQLNLSYTNNIRNTDFNYPNPNPRIEKIDKPIPFKADGKSFLCCSPMSRYVLLGQPLGPEVKALIDIYSNTGIIVEEVLQKHYPNETIHPLINNITAVGQQKTVE